MWVGLTLRKLSCPLCWPPLPPPSHVLLCSPPPPPPTLNTNRYAPTPDMRVLRCVSSRTPSSCLLHRSRCPRRLRHRHLRRRRRRPLLVIVVCKRACDRLSYTTFVTSSRRTLRYLAREREHAHAHVYAPMHTGWRAFRFKFYSTSFPSDTAIFHRVWFSLSLSKSKIDSEFFGQRDICR